MIDICNIFRGGNKWELYYLRIKVIAAHAGLA